MASSILTANPVVQQQQHSSMNHMELDAIGALLGVTPAAVVGTASDMTTSSNLCSNSDTSIQCAQVLIDQSCNNDDDATRTFARRQQHLKSTARNGHEHTLTFSTTVGEEKRLLDDHNETMSCSISTTLCTSEISSTATKPTCQHWDQAVVSRPRSGSVGLDALAALALREQQQDENNNEECAMGIVQSAEAQVSSSNPAPVVSTAATAARKLDGQNNCNNSQNYSRKKMKAFVPFLLSNSSAMFSSSSSSSSSSSEEDNEESNDCSSMPPPPPRQQRRRSSSNPEGMEKWDSMNTGRHFFVLPPAILEEELAEVSAAVERRGKKRNNNSLLSTTATKSSSPSFSQANGTSSQLLAVAASRCQSASTSSAIEKRKNGIGRQEESASATESDQSAAEMDIANDDMQEQEGLTTTENDHQDVNSNSVNNICSESIDAALVPPEELLRRARSRLLEDMSEGNVTGEKGVLTLPHSLAKYKDVYNKNGRIGIYTPSERAAIIARFNQKRARRVWNKKIRYNCRKNLADRRLRIKGRFVKRSEQESLAKRMHQPISTSQQSDKGNNKSKNRNESKKKANSDGNSGHNTKADEAMPDVTDQEAGFTPTKDQPYRRLRRHTIT